MLANPPIRLALKRDARPIAELSRDSIEHGLRWTYDRARILKAISNPTINVAVAHERGRLLGFGIMRIPGTVHVIQLKNRTESLRTLGSGRAIPRDCTGWRLVSSAPNSRLKRHSRGV